MPATAIAATLDLDAPGRQAGRLILPHSPDDDAWGGVSLPIASIRNGEGPCVLVMGGVHGDEYEGPIVINELMRTLEPAQVRGQVILLPLANEPAIRAARRTSGLDGQNLARVFPGNHRGQPTERIAGYITDVLLDRATHLIDLHAGGRSLAILPSVQMLITPAVMEAQRSAMHAMAEAFGLPLSIVSEGAGDNGASVGTAVNRGVAAIAAELGQGGYVTETGVGAAMDGLMRALARINVVPNPLLLPPPPSRRMRMGGVASHLLAPGDGWFERAFELGDEVEAGQRAGRLHDLLRPERMPELVHFPAAGLVYAHGAASRVRAGMNLAVVVTEWRG